MRAVPRDSEEQLGGNGLDSMRTWLVNGAQVVDRRRRFGGHGRTRKLLVADPQARPTTSEHWQSMTAALQRHTVSGALSELEPEHRRVIQLAYLEGNTNRQIASTLGVSVTTVKRRLVKALERLELYISAAGAWLAGVMVALGAFLATRVARLTGPEDVQRVASAAAAVTLAAAAVGVVTLMPDNTTSHSRHTSQSALAPLTTGNPVPAANVDTDIDGPSAPTQAQPTGKGHAKGSGQSDAEAHSGAGSSANPGSNGCHGNPTGAPPQVPVGPRTGHPAGPPVDPPGKGGCKNL